MSMITLTPSAKLQELLDDYNSKSLEPNGSSLAPNGKSIAYNSLTTALESSYTLMEKFNQLADSGELKQIVYTPKRVAYAVPGGDNPYMVIGEAYNSIFALGHEAQHFINHQWSGAETLNALQQAKSDIQAGQRDLTHFVNRYQDTELRSEATANIAGWNDLVNSRVYRNDGYPLTQTQLNQLIREELRWSSYFYQLDNTTGNWKLRPGFSADTGGVGAATAASTATTAAGATTTVVTSATPVIASAAKQSSTAAPHTTAPAYANTLDCRGLRPRNDGEMGATPSFCAVRHHTHNPPLVISATPAVIASAAKQSSTAAPHATAPDYANTLDCRGLRPRNDEGRRGSIAVSGGLSACVEEREPKPCR